ncbi:MAG TPA: transposase [Gammaproteobacteria bacterium]|nr:transposase [Gammaproteobacteria bacterium]
MPRLVVPGYPHHVTQRGNRRQTTFFSPNDYRMYLGLLAEAREAAGIAVWAYCLMPNHVHLVVVPHRHDSLATFFGETHRTYTRRVNFREGWRGHLWQERFHSCVMDERHLLAAVRYTELNPVRAGLCRSAEEWRWSSVHAHLDGTDDMLVAVRPMLDRIDDWPKYLELDSAQSEHNALRQHGRTGRPLGDDAFIECLEKLTGRRLICGEPGRPKDNR